LVEGKPISIGNVAYVLGMSVKKLHRWYQEVLSGFTQAVESKQIGKDDLVVKEDGVMSQISVPILEESNMGQRMAIDEKNIDGTGYTILSNRETNKIALMASTFKTEYLMKLLSRLDLEKRIQVKSLSRDMADNYDWLGRQAFMNAYHVVDKFHVLKNILEQLQSIRIYHRQKELVKKREGKRDPGQETTFSNGDTVLQLLARSRGLLFLPPGKWSPQQQARASILFQQYPDIKQAYHHVLKIRNWYTYPDKDVIKSQKQKNKNFNLRYEKGEKLEQIIEELLKTGLEELKNIAFLLKRHSGQILNYFIAKETNAKAEALNQNLQRFINVNYGARNTDFFLYRVKIHFS
jgi:transposase